MRKKIMSLMMGALLLLTACGQTGSNSASTMLPVAAVQSAAQAIAPMEDKTQEDVDSLPAEEGVEEVKGADDKETPNPAEDTDTPSAKTEETSTSPVFAPVGRFVASQGRGRVRIAAPGIWSVFGPLFGAPKAVAGEKHWRFSAPMPVTAARSADCHEGLRHFAIGADYRIPNVLWRYSL